MTIVTYANAAALELTGYTMEEILGRSVLSFADDQEEATRLLVEFWEKGSWMGEVAGRKKDGSRIVSHMSASLVRGENGEPVGTLCSFVDITRTRRAFEELRIKDHAIASSINAIVFGDLEGRITYVNEAFLRLWGGQDASEVIGLSIFTFVRSKQEVERILQHVFEKGNWQGEITANAKDGRAVIIQISAHLVTDEQNRPICLMGSLVDVTEKKLEQREKDKNELEEMVLANVRSLLLPSLERLRGCRLNDRQKIYVDSLETNLQTIVSPFLHRFSNRFLNLTPVEIQVASLVKEGKSSKEIASMINVSERGVEFHRNNIRRKLGLNNAKTNLRSYLLSLS
ncbi:MAG: hypothetical protein CVU51_03875 [Deltaproteobacteria bacterium HGW-Deltaproteobacteria-1]|nr:MAG: hypothetical protein CVU51_03875 [Deltaproteobacteria bacterium HGW-Deltaproteobacteria-1]